LEVGSTILGRGELLGIADKRCSRRQLELKIDADGSASLTVVSTHKTRLAYTTALNYIIPQHGVNPSYLFRKKSPQDKIPMLSGETYPLRPGDSFTLLLDDHKFSFDKE
jgi:hypothetical protein